jgi:hypothetical protein
MTELLSPAREAAIAEMTRLKEIIVGLQTELIRAQTEYSVLQGRLSGLNDAADLLNQPAPPAKLAAE